MRDLSPMRQAMAHIRSSLRSSSRPQEINSAAASRAAEALDGNFIDSRQDHQLSAPSDAEDPLHEQGCTREPGSCSYWNCRAYTDAQAHFSATNDTRIVDAADDPFDYSSPSTVFHPPPPPPAYAALDRNNHNQDRDDFYRTLTGLQQTIESLNVRLDTANSQQPLTTGPEGNPPMHTLPPATTTSNYVPMNDLHVNAPSRPTLTTAESYASFTDDDTVATVTQHNETVPTTTPIYVMQDGSSKVGVKRVQFNQQHTGLTSDNQPSTSNTASTPYYLENNKTCTSHDPSPRPYMYLDKISDQPRSDHGEAAASQGKERFTLAVPKIKREFIKESANTWLKAMESSFESHGVISERAKFESALSNIPTVYLDRLSPYLADRTFRSLADGIRKVFGQCSYSQRLSIVEALQMTSSPRALLNNMLSTLGLPISGLSEDRAAFIKHLFLKKMPTKIRLALAVLPDQSSLDDMCNVATNCYNALVAAPAPDRGLSHEVDNGAQIKELLSEVKSLKGAIEKNKQEPQQLAYINDWNKGHQNSELHSGQRQQHHQGYHNNFNRQPQWERQPHNVFSYHSNNRMPPQWESAPNFSNNLYRRHGPMSSETSRFNRNLSPNFNQIPEEGLICFKHKRYGHRTYGCNGRNPWCQFYRSSFLGAGQQRRPPA